MKPQASFGRRAPPAPLRRGGTAAVALTPAQRALLFAPGDGVADSGAARKSAPWSRCAGFVACAVASALAVALSLARQEGEPNAFALAFQLFSIASNISVSCWLAQKLCCWRGLSGFVAYGLAGAGVNLGLSWLGAQLGLGESDLGYAADAVAGGGAALLYLLLAGRNRLT